MTTTTTPKTMATKLEEEGIYFTQKNYNGGRHAIFILHEADKGAAYKMGSPEGARFLGTVIKHFYSDYSKLDAEERETFRKDVLNKSYIYSHAYFNPATEDKIFKSASRFALVRNLYTPYKPIDRDLISEDEKTLYLKEWDNYMLLMFPIPEQREAFFRYLAQWLKFPHVRPTTHWMLRSDVGVGKGTLVEKILTPLAGNGMKSATKMSQLLGKHANVLVNSTMAYVDEFDASSNSKKKIWGGLKSITSTTTVNVEFKNVDATELPCYTRIIALCNPKGGMGCEEDIDRRWQIPQFMTWYNNDPVAHEKLMIAFNNFIDNPIHTDKFLSCVYYFLMDIKGITAKEDVCYSCQNHWESKIEYMAMSKGMLAGALDAFVEGKHAFTFKFLRDYLKWEGIYQGETREDLQSKLEYLGFEYLSRLQSNLFNNTSKVKKNIFYIPHKDDGKYKHHIEKIAADLEKEEEFVFNADR